jgi:DNA-nicking Smr family endonuclease
VHIVTGKGRGSAGMPVLKTRVRTLLRDAELHIADFAEDLDGGGYLVRLHP